MFILFFKITIITGGGVVMLFTLLAFYSFLINNQHLKISEVKSVFLIRCTIAYSRKTVKLFPGRIFLVEPTCLNIYL